MIPLPTPPVRGQRIQADLLRDLIAAVRRCRPIQGQGILLQETLQGTVIALAGRPKTAAAETLDHRFKVSLRVGGEADAPTYALHIRKGSLFAVEGEVATEQPLALEGLEQDPDDADAWRVAAPQKGSLYIRKETEEGKQGYTLAYGEPQNALFTIADFTPSESSSNPHPKVTQRLLGDRYAFKGGSGGGGLTVGPPELIADNGETALAWFAGTVAWAGETVGFRFIRSTKPDGSPADPLFTLPIVAHRKDHAPGIPYTEQ